MLEHFFGSKTRVKLLYLFFQRPERALYVRELSRIIGIQLHAVRRELVNLERFGIIQRSDQPKSSEQTEKNERSKYYVLNKHHIVYEELQAFLGKAHVFEQKKFIDELLRVGGDIRYCLLTGFFTRSRAPTDMLLVGTLDVPAIEKHIAAYEREHHEAIQYTLMDEAEFKERRAVGDTFLARLLESPHSVMVNELLS